MHARPAGPTSAEVQRTVPIPAVPELLSSPAERYYFAMQDMRTPVNLTAAQRAEVSRLFGAGTLNKPSEKASDDPSVSTCFHQ
jgi:hypothetical protein